MLSSCLLFRPCIVFLIVRLLFTCGNDSGRLENFDCIVLILLLNTLLSRWYLWMKLSRLIRFLVIPFIRTFIGWLGEHLYLSACMRFLISLLWPSEEIAVVSSITLIGVDFMAPVMSLIAWFWTLSSMYSVDFDADVNVVDPYSRCGRIAPM